MRWGVQEAQLALGQTIGAGFTNKGSTARIEAQGDAANFDKPYMGIKQGNVLYRRSNAEPRSGWDQFWGGVGDFFGDLLGFDEGRFSLGNIGLSGANAAAVDEAWDGVLTVTAPVREAWDDFSAPVVQFYHGWEARGRTNNAVPEAGLSLPKTSFFWGAVVSMVETAEAGACDDGAARFYGAWRG